MHSIFRRYQLISLWNHPLPSVGYLFLAYKCAWSGDEALNIIKMILTQEIFLLRLSEWRSVHSELYTCIFFLALIISILRVLGVNIVLVLSA